MEDNNNEELPEIQTKLINGVEFTNKDIAKISMICDYLVVDHFHDVSSFIRLERCFGPFFSKEGPNFLPEVHKEICGPKKKYITYGRLIAAYAKWKSKSSTNECFNKFMDLVFGDMIKSQEEVVGKLVEGGRIFSTRNTRGRKVISKFSVITDETKNQIGGFHIQYDDFFDSVLSPIKTKENISLEMNFAPNGREIRDRDGISHIGGKYSITKDIIKFLVFKCRSGKTFYIGDNSEDDQEEIKLFIFGATNCQLRALKMRLAQEKLTYLEPNFQSSLRVNQKLIPFDSIDDKFINENITNHPLIFEENEIQSIPIEELDLNTLIIPYIADDAFIDKESLVEKNCGKNFDEVYNSFINENNKEEDAEKEELKQQIYNKTIQRKHLLKIYFNRFKIKENILVLKNSSEQPEERIDMDKHLVKIESIEDIMDVNDNKKNQENEKDISEDNKIEEEKNNLKETKEESKDEDNKNKIIEGEKSNSKRRLLKKIEEIKKEKDKEEIKSKEDNNELNKKKTAKKILEKYDEKQKENKEELKKEIKEEDRDICPKCIIF